LADYRQIAKPALPAPGVLVVSLIASGEDISAAALPWL
jgi:hypothetical protein